MTAVRMMAAHIKRHPFLWALGLFVPPLAALGANLAFAYGLQAYTAELTGRGAALGRVALILLVTLAVLLAATLIEDLARYLFAIFIVKTENDVRQGLFSSLVRAKYQELGRLDRGELLTRCNADAGAATNLITWDLFSVLWPLILGTGYLAAIFSTNWIIGLVMLALCVAVIVLNLFFVKRFAALEKAGLECRECFTQAIGSVARGKMSVRLLSAGSMLSGGIRREARTLYDNENAKVRLSTARAGTLDLFATVCSTMTAPLACVLAAVGAVPLSAVVLIAQLCRYFILFTNGLGVALTSFKAHSVSYSRLRQILGIAGEKTDGGEGPRPDEGGLVLECSDVGISYGGRDVLTGASFSIRRGEIVALAGPSGCGKSSIVKALLRLIDHSGEIRLFGRSIEDIPLQALRQSVACVPEHSEVFDTTVLENLSYAAPDADEGRICQALRDAALDDGEIAGREAGSGGGRVSGGQRQRIAIARALLKDAPLLILDEPTASLDAESERRVLETLKGLRDRGTTVLIITHRPSTWEIADRRLTICDRRVVNCA